MRALFAGGGLRALVERYGDSLAIVLVYVDEAHATDEWPIASSQYAPRGAPVAYAAARSDADRAAAARDLLRDFQVPHSVQCVTDALAPSWTLLDAEDGAWANGGAAAAAAGNAPPQHTFINAYAAWPFRWFIMTVGADIMDVHVARVGWPDGSAWNFERLESAVAEAAAAQQQA